MRLDLETNVGPWSLRVWGLIVNLAANALALYGAAGIVRDGSRLPLLILGCAVTLACILVLAVPTRDEEGPDTERPDERRGIEPNREE